MDISERFWSKVDIRGDDECWPFLGNAHRQGYGFFKVGKVNKLAHRIAYFLTHGIWLPSSTKLLHKCDNPPCCNPKHLKPGTQGDNVRDMVSKGRYVGTRKLTPDQVVAIYDDCRVQREIAADYDVDLTVVTVIKNGRSYAPVTSSLGRPPGRPAPRSRMSIEVKKAKRRAYMKSRYEASKQIPLV